MAAKEMASRKQSVAITSTQSAATAFGEDIADDAYSVSELSHVEEEKRVKRVRGHHPALAHTLNSREAFLRPAVRRGPERLQSCIEDSQRPTSTSTPSPPVPAQNGKNNNDTTDAVSDSERSPGSSGNDVTLTESDDLSINSSESSFANFARTRFHLKGTTHAYCCSALPHPLLSKEHREDYLASLAAWVLILRIMGDLPDRDTTDTLHVAGDQPPVINEVRTNYRIKYTKKDVEDAQSKYSELFKDPQGADMEGVPFLPDRCDTMLEKVQYLIGLGIYRPELRDELYCQLCKQLTNNPSRNSSVRGWVLLSLFAGSFAPSEKFAAAFAAFLLEGPKEFAQKVDRLVRRTCAVGTRAHPPSWLEFQASKNNKPLLVPVTFMNGYRTLCEVDSASTVQELLRGISDKIGLHDPAGFSIFVTLHTKISCLGHGSHRVMDAISECEQHTKQMGMRESSSLWRLFFRREYFIPWDGVVMETDPVNADLIYQQVMRGLSLGEYKCEKEEVLVLLAAQRFYIEHSGDSQFDKLDHFVRTWLTDDMLNNRPAMYYVDKVRETLRNDFLQSKPDPLSLKKDIVLFAMDKWYLLFSRIYDAPKVVGPGVSLSKVMVGVNNRGLYVLDDTDTIRLHLAFWEVAAVSKGRQLATIRSLKGDDYVMTLQHCDDFFILLTSFIQGLRLRSHYAVVTQDIAQSDNGSNVTVMRGDMVVLDKAYGETSEEVSVSAVCSRTSSACHVPRDKLYILATAEEPTGEMLGGVVMQLKKDPSCLVNEVQYKPPNLQLFSRQHFRPVSESTVTKFLHKASLKRDKNDSLWQYSRDPLKKPLLKRTCNRDELRRPACRAFSAIQQYMGDLTVKQEISDVELANAYVIDPARRNKYLREEIYCQLMKQLTNNPHQWSEDKGWVLMTLLCATVVPVGELLDQCEGFFRAARHRLARICADLLLTQRTGNRLFPPHTLEHEMVAKQQPNVRMQVMLPSGTPVTVEVGHRTTVSEMKRDVQKRLRLQSVSEYSLFLSATDTLHSVPERGFYFDCLALAETFLVRQSASNRNSGTEAPLLGPSLVMLKKIWVNVTPGEDPEADKHFHFPQEVPNFLRGYHKATQEEVTKMAALLYRSRFSTDASHFSRFSEIASTLLPRGYPQNRPLDDVRKEVEEEYRTSNGVSPDEVRARFLRLAVTWPTYGCVFFEVKQRVMKTLPKYCLLAVNTAGVHISDLQSKDVVRTYEFNKIPNWAHDSHSFTLIILTDSGTSRLLLETNVGHNMDDVLMAHIAWVMNAHMKRKHGFYNQVGESLC